MTSKSPVGDISDVTLIRTDTTLDHSQKAEKVWAADAPEQTNTKYESLAGRTPARFLKRQHEAFGVNQYIAWTCKCTGLEPVSAARPLVDTGSGSQTTC